jgi:hypothetical protein
MPKNLAWTQKTGGLYVTLTSEVVVYAPAERADPLPLLRLSPSLWQTVCGCGGGGGGG